MIALNIDPADSSITRKMPLSQLTLRCPPLPETVFHAMRLKENPDLADTSSVLRMIQRDPAMTAHLLHTVNSAYYGLRSAVNSLERAVVLLGPLRALEIVATSNLSRLQTLFEAPVAASFARLIRHSTATAFLTRFITVGSAPRSREKPVNRNDIGFTAGLIHELGKLSLIYNFPGEAASLYQVLPEAHLRSTQETLELERRTFGYDHLEAGEYIARRFSLPADLISVIRHHHNPFHEEISADHLPLVLAVSAAKLCARALGFGCERPVSIGECEASAVWAAAAAIYPDRFVSGEQLFQDLQAQRDHVRSHVEILTYPVPGFIMSYQPSGGIRLASQSTI